MNMPNKLQLSNAYLIVERPKQGAYHVQGHKVLYEFGMGCCKGTAYAPAHRMSDQAESAKVEVPHGAFDMNHVVHEVVPDA